MGYKLKKVTIWRDNSRLPSEYQEVEYIQSSGTQWIDTGKTVSGDVKVEYTYMPNETQTSSSTTGVLFGMDNGWDSNGFGEGNQYLYYGTARTGAGLPQANTKYDVVLSKQICSRGNFSYTPSASYPSPSGTLKLFMWQRNGSLNTYLKCKLYSFKRYDSGVLTQDLVPCYRKSDSVIGLYDLVTNAFFTNAGTGTFTKGNNVGGLQEKQVRPTGWKPGANTLAYYPFSSDETDVIGNTSLSVSGTQETLGRSFNSSVMINSFPSTSVKTSSVWFKVDALSVTGNVQIFILRTQPGCYMVKDSQYNGAFYMYKNGNYYASAPWTQGQWTNIVITVANNYLVCYKDGVQYTLGNGTLQDAYNQLINISGTCNFVMSDLIFEDATRTQQDVLDYYNLTKGKYGL